MKVLHGLPREAWRAAGGFRRHIWGGPFGLDALTLDYAYQRYHGMAGGAHRLAVRIR